MAVTGIGGLFFRASDPDSLKRWYCEHLGIGCNDWGMWEQQAGTTVFSPFKADTDYFPADKQYMLNLRVEHIDGLLEKLRGAGIEVVTKPEWDDPSVGRFARIHDPDGNPVELWQPPAS
jgi:predicted enzyme related to lactoylglutathione lyase